MEKTALSFRGRFPAAFALALLLASFQNVLAATTLTVTGTVKYEKTRLTHPPEDLPEAVLNEPLKGATVKAFVGGVEKASAITSATGAFTMEVTFFTDYSLTVYASGSSVDVRQIDAYGNEGATYSCQVAASGNSAGPHDRIITRGENSGAFNIFTQFLRGREWSAARGYQFSRTLKALWPSPYGTQFDPPTFNFHIQHLTSPYKDPDEFDDDVILHEFGHAFTEEFSKDDSAGGTHGIHDKLDLRLSWSEGVGHFISSAVRDSAWHIDSKGTTDAAGNSVADSFRIDDTSSFFTGSENEVAVAYVLWKAYKEVGGTEVLGTMSDFKTLPSAISSDPISMDTFRDLWPGASLDVIYGDRMMSYYADSASSNTHLAPFEIADPSYYQFPTLTFYPEGNKDYFSFVAAAGEIYDIETLDAKNGALTTLNVYRENLSTLVASNSQRNSLRTDTTSLVRLSVDTAGRYIVQALRFNSSTLNYGPAAYDYDLTAGRYGSYSFKITRTQAATFSSSGSQAATGTTATTGGSSTSTETASNSGTSAATAASGGGGGGGGCILGEEPGRR